MTSRETGYDDAITCECVYNAATDDMDRQDCAVHADLHGNPYPAGACCAEYLISGYLEHAATCGNAQPTTHEERPELRLAEPTPSHMRCLADAAHAVKEAA